jgi:AraC-like DNA-binding protein
MSLFKTGLMPPMLTGSGPIVRFSAADFPEGSRDVMWLETLRRHIVALEVEKKDHPLGKPNHANSVGMALPGLGVVAFNAAYSTVRRTRRLLADSNENLRLVILRRSTTAAAATQFGREIAVDAGNAVVLLNSEQNSISFPFRRPRVLALNLRQQGLRPLLRDFDRILKRPIPGQLEALRLLSNYIDGLMREPALSSADVARLVVAQVYDLAALIMGATGDAAEIAKGRGLRVARLRAIKSDIAERLAAPELSVESVAMRQGVSPRYVQMLFEQEGTTFSQYVIGQRLIRAYRMLTNPLFDNRSITSVAFDTGFSDLSYFNRAFRRCFGGTPSEIRADATRRKDA